MVILICPGCEEGNKQGGNLKDGLMLCRLMTRLQVLYGTGVSGSKPGIHYYEFSVLWKEPGGEKADGKINGEQ